MRSPFPAFLLTLLAWPAAAQDKKPEPVRLSLNTGGHTSPVTSMVFTPDGTKLVTCERTKVHVWDLAAGELERTWRLHGTVATVAVSANGKTVAAMGNVSDTPVWLLDVATGDARGITVPKIDGRYGTQGLVFSPKGGRLAFCTTEVAGLIGVETGKVSHLYRRAGTVQAVAFDETGGRLFINGGNPPKQDQAQVYDITPNTGKHDTPLFELEKSAETPNRIAWSTDGSYFAGWFREYGSRIFFWTADGKRDKSQPVLTLPDNSFIHHLRFVGPDKLVAVGTFADRLRAYLIDAKTHKLLRTGEFPWAEPPTDGALAFAVSPTGDRLAVTAAPGYRVRLFDLANNKPLPDVGKAFAVPNAVAWGPDNRSLSWALGADARGRPIPPRGLNLATLTPLAADDVKGFKAGIPGGYALEFVDNRKLVLVRQGKRTETAFDAPPIAHAFFKDPAGKLKVAVLGKWNRGRLCVIDVETGSLTQIEKFSEGTALAVSPDGRFLAVAKHDQALSVYPTDGGRPLLFVLAAGPDWVVWTYSGYYAATLNGERLIGFADRSDPSKPLPFYPVERFRKRLYQPDVIRQVLAKGSVAAAVKTAPAPLVEEVKLAEILPPKAVLQLLAFDKATGQAKVRAAATSPSGKAVEALRLQLDGSSLPDGQGYLEPKPGEKAEATWEVTVPPGSHQLQVFARGPDSTDWSNTVPVEADVPPGHKPTMHVLAVGVNYDWDAAVRDDPGQLKAAEGDAGVMVAALTANCSGPKNRFGSVKATTLLGRQATKPAVKDALKAIHAGGAKPGDLVVVFYSGHGVAQGREFYLLTADLDPKDIPKNCLSGSDLKAALKAMPCPVLLVFDACQSGKALDNFAGATDEIGRAVADDEAGTTVLAAAMSTQAAQEAGGRGRLTRAVQDVLSLAPDAIYDRTGKVMNVHHLYVGVADAVRRASDGKQHPVLFAPWTAQPLVIRTVP